MHREYDSCDALTDRPLVWQAVAALPDAAELDAGLMQPPARQFNLSETSLVLPGARGGGHGCARRVPAAGAPLRVDVHAGSGRGPRALPQGRRGVGHPRASGHGPGPGPLGAYPAWTGSIDPDGGPVTFVSCRGVEMGRLSELALPVRDEGGGPALEVGGAARRVAAGWLEL